MRSRHASIRRRRDADLDGGRWGDQQVVPEQWVTDSTTTSKASEGIYSYQMWLDVDHRHVGNGRTEEQRPTGEDQDQDPNGALPDDLFHAAGHDSQRIFVIPSLDLVVVRNGTYAKYDGPPIADPNLITHYPSDGHVPGKGTLAAGNWDDTDFLTLVLKAIKD